MNIPQYALNRELFTNNKFRELEPNLVGRKFANKNFPNFTIDCLYFETYAEIFATKKISSGVNSQNNANIIGCKNFQFRVWSYYIISYVDCAIIQNLVLEVGLIYSIL